MIGIITSIILVVSTLYLLPKRPPMCSDEAVRLTSSPDIERIELDVGKESYMITMYMADYYVVSTSFSPALRTHNWYRTNGFVHIGTCIDLESDDTYHIAQRTDSKEIN